MTIQFEIIDPRFSDKIDAEAKLEEVFSDGKWTEGPVWIEAAQSLYFSDIPNQRVLSYRPSDGLVTTFMAPSNFANGHTTDREGRLISCEHGTRRVTRLEADGSTTVLADSFEGKRLNSPNDVVVRSDGSIWFTDPTYGILSDYEGHKADPEQKAHGVYRIDPRDGRVSLMIEDFVQPNGLAFSLDENRLFVSESGFSHDPNVPRHIRAFDLAEDGQAVIRERVFCTIDNGLADGFRFDSDGFLWTSAWDGVHVFDPDGKLCGKVRIPQVVSNLTFGPPGDQVLYITATKSLYVLKVRAEGAQRPSPRP